MSTEIDDNVCESDSFIGRVAIFKRPESADGQNVLFCSQIDLIGTEFKDRVIKNNSEVMIISEPQMVQTERYGLLQVVKVLRGQTMWIPTIFLHLQKT